MPFIEGKIIRSSTDSVAIQPKDTTLYTSLQRTEVLEDYKVGDNVRIQYDEYTSHDSPLTEVVVWKCILLHE